MRIGTMSDDLFRTAAVLIFSASDGPLLMVGRMAAEITHVLLV